MKRFIVEQNGFVKVEAFRVFVVEVPDHITEEQVQEFVETETFPEDEDMAWWDEPDRSWSGYDVEFTDTEVHDPDAFVGGPDTKRLKVIRLEGLDTIEQKGVRS